VGTTELVLFRQIHYFFIGIKEHDLISCRKYLIRHFTFSLGQSRWFKLVAGRRKGITKSTLETRRAFGFLFVAVSIAVIIASVLSEFAYSATARLPLYYYVIIWLASFGAVFGAGYRYLRKSLPGIQTRMKTSTRWPTVAKILNGICWAGPFAAIAAFPSFYQYLILAGIGLGNLSTYLMIKKYSNTVNPEQMIVGLVSLAAIPAAVMIDSTIFATRQDIAVMLSRIFIGISYGAGGAFALLGKAGPVGFDPTTSGSLQ
jgi:hypothetical protein